MATDPSPRTVAQPADLSLVELCWRLLRSNKTTKQRTLWLSPINPPGAGASSGTLAGKWPATSSPLIRQSRWVDGAMAEETKRSGRCRLLSLAAILYVALSIPHVSAAEALSPPAQRGLTFVRTHCANCHAIGTLGESPLRIAPPFRTLHTKYPVESLQEALAEGIVTGHPTMPEFRLDPGQITDVISYLKSLEH